MPSAPSATSLSPLPAPGRLSFDHALCLAAPWLTPAERRFLASVAGFAPRRAFAPGAYRAIEGVPFGAGEGLVTYIDAAWKRCLQTLTGEAICRSSARFALTHAGRALVLRAARLIEGSAA
jgi:hypothetical protein